MVEVGAMMGRLTKTVIDALVSQLEEGARVEPACRLAGISKYQYHKWLSEGRGYIERQLEPTTAHEKLLIELAERVDNIQADAITAAIAVNNITEAVRAGDLKATQFYLRNAPGLKQKWASRQEITGAGGTPIEIRPFASADTTDIERLIAAYSQSPAAQPTTPGAEPPTERHSRGD